MGTDGVASVFDYGRLYILLSSALDRGFQIASGFMESGSDVLCVSRLDPDLARDSWARAIPDYMWLTERAGENRVSPARLPHLVRHITQFAHYHHRAMVFLDGVEYLALYNEFPRLQMFVEHMNDLAMETGAVIVLAVDPRSFDRRSLARLIRFAEVVH